MNMKYSLFWVFFLALTWASPAAYSTEAAPTLTAVKTESPPATAPLTANLWYKFYWSGLYAGDIIIGVTETEGKYEARAVIETQDMVRTISRFWSDTSIHGTREKGAYRPTHYDTYYHRRKGGGRKIVLDYEGDARIVKEDYNPPENRQKRPAVPPEQRDGAPDPITLALVVRQKLRALLDAGTKKFTMRMFDGRRLSDVNFEIVGKDIIEVKERRRDVIHIVYEQSPVAGYTNNEMKRLAGENPRVDIYISDDDRLIPLQVEGTAMMGTASAMFRKECRLFEECLELAKKQ
ncbi:MAG: DUF3108 domain-containing protein [Alphaproteobacteria bacterium]|nr:DUF3108 domain-containing protein [Alphaproteobacteria bacterium]